MLESTICADSYTAASPMLARYRELNNIACTAVWRGDNWQSVECSSDDGMTGCPANTYATKREAVGHAKRLAELLDVPYVGYID